MLVSKEPGQAWILRLLLEWGVKEQRPFSLGLVSKKKLIWGTWVA